MRTCRCCASYFERQMEVLGVNVMLNTEATADIIAEASPDIVIAATGGVRDTLGLSDTAGTRWWASTTS